jgi:tRNA A-37 threonylcarbamoyl transferase component Bud32
VGERWLSQLAAAGSDAGDYLSQLGGLVKDGAASQAWLVEFEGVACFAKLYRHKSPLRRFLPGVTARRPRRAFHMASTMHREGLAVPRPLCCIAVPAGVLLLSAALARCESLAVAWPSLPAQRRKDCLALAARALAALHRAGYSHGDCKWHNLVIVRDTCYLVDLERARRGAGDRGRARDVGRFAVAAEEAGVSQDQFDAWRLDYQSRVGLQTGDSFMAAASRYADLVRRRHARRYGLASRPLL